MAVIELRGDCLMELGQFDAAVDAYYAVYQQSGTQASCRKLAGAYLSNGAKDAASKLDRACESLKGP
jgi:predicted negative regulator of RcsB-dependent stress response